MASQGLSSSSSSSNPDGHGLILSRRSASIQLFNNNVQSRPPHLPPVDYGDQHPFDEQHQRNLRSHDHTRNLLLLEDDSSFRPIRITLDFANLEESKGLFQNQLKSLKIKELTTKVLPYVVDFYQQAVSVIPIKGTLPLEADVCEGFQIDNNDQLTNGIGDSDLFILVSNQNEINGKKMCSNKIERVAAAAPCSLDQFDRPITGFINFCLDRIDVDSIDETITEQSLTHLKNIVIHEFAHILGFNSASWKFFRFPGTGKPRTSRPFVEESFICVDGRTQNVVVPGCNTLGEGVSSNGMRYFEITTPAVRQVTRNHFGCQTLTGARLENQPTDPDDCFGSHWDERYFYNEVVSAYLGEHEVNFSPLTLALLEDSGWYKANYSMAEVSISSFGHGAGCDFVEKKCIVANKVPEYAKGIFCAKGNVDTCDPSYTHKAQCDLREVNDNAFRPEAAHYFRNKKVGVKRLIEADYCPVALLNPIDCRFSSTESHSWLLPGESYGPSSKCFKVNVNKKQQAVCLATFCNDSTHTLTVFPEGADAVECTYDHQVLQYKRNGQILELTCPRLIAVCPQFYCPSNCSGRGVCEYKSHMAQCKCYNDLDKTPSCSETPLKVEEDQDCATTPPITLPGSENVPFAMPILVAFAVCLFFTIIFAFYRKKAVFERVVGERRAASLRSFNTDDNSSTLRSNPTLSIRESIRRRSISGDEVAPVLSLRSFTSSTISIGSERSREGPPTPQHNPRKQFALPFQVKHQLSAFTDPSDNTLTRSLPPTTETPSPSQKDNKKKWMSSSWSLGTTE